VCLGPRVSHEIEGDGVPAVQRNAARIGDFHNAQQAGHGDFAVAVHRGVRRGLLRLLDLLGDRLLLLLLFVGVQRLAILRDRSLNSVSVHEEDLVFFGLGLFQPAIAVQFVGLH
jgi:hypothetical protein